MPLINYIRYIKAWSTSTLQYNWDSILPILLSGYLLGAYIPTWVDPSGGGGHYLNWTDTAKISFILPSFLPSIQEGSSSSSRRRRRRRQKQKVQRKQQRQKKHSHCTVHSNSIYIYRWALGPSNIATSINPPINSGCAALSALGWSPQVSVLNNQPNRNTYIHTYITKKNQDKTKISQRFLACLESHPLFVRQIEEKKKKKWNKANFVYTFVHTF